MKKARASGLFFALIDRTAAGRLLQFRFLVEHVLAHARVELLDFDLVRRRALVLGRGVEVTGSRSRFELDLLAHGGLLKPPFSSLRSRPAPLRRRACRSCAG